MTSRSAATRYARALFDVSVKEADPQRIEQELAGIVELFERHEVLRKVLLNPAVPAGRKRAAIVELAERANVSPVLQKLLALVAERDRLVLLPDLLEAFRRRLLDHLHIVGAEVTTAVPLAGDRAQAIADSLAKLTGREVRMTTRVEPSVVGGVVARIGSTVYDGSVRGQLRRIRQRLSE